MVNAAGDSAVAHARTHVVGEVRLNAEEQRRRTSAEAAIRLHGYQAVELQVRSSHMWRVTRAKIDAAKSWRKNEFPSTAVLNILPADRAFDTSRMVHCVAMYSHFVVRTPEFGSAACLCQYSSYVPFTLGKCLHLAAAKLPAICDDLLRLSRRT